MASGSHTRVRHGEGSDTLDEVLSGIVIVSPTVYSWFGTRSQDLPGRIKKSIDADVTRSFLLTTLTSQLYRDFYGQGRPVPIAPVATSESRAEKEQLVADLTAANAGTGAWSPGWTVRSTDGRHIVVERDGLSLWAVPDQLRGVIGEDGAAQVGSVLRLPLPSGAKDVSPGFYMIRGDTETPHGAPLVRLYWNLTSEGAPALIRRATAVLNEAATPFHLKVVDSPEQYNRCDAGVLYLPRSAYPGVEVLAGIHEAVDGLLRRHTPAFTKELAPGLGLAEDPGGGRSFGEHRCRLLAESLIQAYERGATGAQRRAVVVEQFDAAGISLDAPYLCPGSVDRYPVLPVRSIPRAPTRTAQPTVGGHHEEAPLEPDRLLDAAVRIGRQLVEGAVWDGDRCNWVSLTQKDPTRLAVTPSIYSALNTGLYDGTSGIALFLAYLYAAAAGAGDVAGTADAVRRTALGAIRQALSNVEDVSPRYRFGLLTGWPGIALTAVQAAAALDAPELLDGVRSLVARLVTATDEEIDAVDPDAGRPEFDLLGGRAGAILGLLALADRVSVPGVDAFAARLGDRLLATAEPSAAGLSWKGPDDFRTPHNLAGLSHGTAGAGAAFVELFRITDDERYRRGAREAFNYERHWFDAVEGNWPDLRGDMTTKRPRRSGPFPFRVAWCHGAPGIALSRIRAYAVLGDETYYKEAAIALQATREKLLRDLTGQAASFSLCHGFAGNADVMLSGWQAFGADFGDGHLAAHQVARAGLEQYGERGRPWPCLNGGEEGMSLMIGAAGVGYFLLRLRDPSVPSVLLVEPDSTR
jgi:hypothetical protein